MRASIKTEPLIALIDALPRVDSGGLAFEIIQSWGFVGPTEDNCALTKQQIGNTALRDFAVALEFDTLVPAGSYLRWAHDRGEISLARCRQLRVSKNHRTKLDEIGLSVSEGPWIYWASHSYCYFVTGARVGAGSDAEPCLDPSTLNVVGDLYSREEMVSEFCCRNAERVASLAKAHDISADDWIHFILGAYHTEAPGRIVIEDLAA